MSLQIKPLEEKRKSSSPPPPSLSPLSFSLLPDEITINYLARVPRLYYSTLSIVSKSFYSLLSSSDLYRERSLLGSTEQCLYVCLKNLETKSAQWFALLINPIQTLWNSSMFHKKNIRQLLVPIKKRTNRQLLVPILPPNVPLLSNSTAVLVGSEVYVIGGVVNSAPSSAVQVLDCRTHTWRHAPSMNIPRHDAVSCFYDGKIYVIGGYKGEDDESWAEVFDTKTQSWGRLPCPYTKMLEYFNYNIKEMEGKIYVSSDYWSKKYAYDTKQGKWECCYFTIPRPVFVIDNVNYSCYQDPTNGHLRCWWYDTNAKIGGEVKGLNSLRQKCMMNGNSYHMGSNGFVSCGGKLLLMWQVYMKMLCAKVAVEKRDGDEVWGIVEWVDIMDNIPTSYDLLHLLVVSV